MRGKRSTLDAAKAAAEAADAAKCAISNALWMASAVDNGSEEEEVEAADVALRKAERAVLRAARLARSVHQLVLGSARPPKRPPKFRVRIVWGSSAEAHTPCDYEFATKAELDAFLSGVDEAQGWLDYRIARIVPKQKEQ